MLTWKETTDGWSCSDFRIEYAGPKRWLLLTAAELSSGPAVRIAQTPLATTTTLSGCKRQAEQIIVSRTRSELRRQHTGLTLGAAAAAVLVAGINCPWNVFACTALVLTAVRSLGVVVGASIGRYLAHTEDLFYQ